MLVKQRVQTKIQVVIALLTTMLIAALVHGGIASAATANTLKISPVRTDIDIKPGEKRVVKVTVTNVTDSPITVRPLTNDFISGDERGTPALILDENKFAPTHSLKRFMGELSDVTIPADTSKTVSVAISVPKDAQAGGYFGAVRFAPATPNSGGQVNLSASVASLILLKVPGKATEKLNLTNFTIQQNGTPGAYFNTSDNLEAVVRFESKSSVQVGPFGKVSVTKGDRVVHEVDFNNKNPRDVILPDTARRWEIPLRNIGDFGYYTVHGTFTYGESNQTIEVTKSFWIVPMWLIIAAIGGLVLLIVMIVGVWVLMRRRNHRRRRAAHHRQGGLRRR